MFTQILKCSTLHCVAVGKILYLLVVQKLEQSKETVQYELFYSLIGNSGSRKKRKKSKSWRSILISKGETEECC